MLDVALCVALWILVLLPGVLFAARFLQRLSLPSRVFVGSCASVALLTFVGFIETRLLGVAAITPALWPLLLAGALFACRSALRPARWREANAAFTRSPELQGLAALVVGSLFVRVIPLPFSLLPPGYDPTFHLLLAKMIATANAIPGDWLPFEPVAMNYLPGLHNLLALLSKASSLELTLIWRSLYPVFGTLAVIGVYGFARLLSPQRSTALWIAGAYSVLVNMGSLEIYGWGGMINLGAWCLGVALLLLASESAAARATGWPSLTLGGLLFAAVCLSHPHVTLSVGIVLAAVSVVAWRRFREAGLHRALLGSLIIGGALSAFYLLPYALKVTRLGDSAALTYLEPFYGPTQLLRSLGLIFPLGAILGARQLLRLRGELPGAVLITAMLVLVGLFVGLEYGYGGVHYALTGQRVQPLVPARFLTNSVVFLAVPVGLFLQRALGWARARNRALAMAFVVALAAQPVYHVALLCLNTTPEKEYRALVWLRDRTPADAFVINDRGSRWVNYFCWRETSFTPLSASEPAARDPRPRIEAALHSGRPVYLMGFLPRVRPVFPSGPLSIYRVRADPTR